MKQFAPKVQVMLHRVMWAVSPAAINITDWLGDGCSIHTSKSCREPAGSFQISFVDKSIQEDQSSGPQPTQKEVSLYSRIYPMDVIEIRAARKGSDPVKLIMRGFVSSVTREESMGKDGKPVRRVLVSGHDIGKIFLTQMMHFTPGSQDNVSIMSQYGKYLKYYPGAKPKISAEEFLDMSAKIIDRVLTTILAQTTLAGELSVTSYCHPSVTGTVLAQFMTDTSDISFWKFITQNMDAGPFHEVFIRDTGAGATLVCKPNFSTSGTYTVNITDEDVISISSSRSDAGVANFFRVLPRGGQMVDAVSSQFLANQTSLYDMTAQRDYPHVAEKFFGWRKMEVTASLYPPGWSYDDARTEVSRLAKESDLYVWLQTRMETLRNLNIDNLLFETSTFRIRGNENFLVGNGFTLKRGGVDSTHYAVSVEHEIQIYESFITTIRAERGSAPSGSDYKKELVLKGVAS